MKPEASTGRAVRLTAEARRAQLLNCALEVFASRGLSEARHTDVAAAAGVSVPTMFHYYPTREVLAEAVLAEVSRFLLEDILAAIRVVAAGDALIAPSVTRRLIEEFAGRPEPAPPRRTLTGVTDRERQVLTLVGRGMSNAEIAAELVVSVATAKAHVARLFTKLAARDRVHLVIIAYEAGLATPPR